MTRHTMKEVHLLDGIKKLVNKWGSQSRGKSYKGRAEFLNHTKDKFEWENDNITTGEMTDEVEPIYPNLIAEIPGVELETDFEDILEDDVQETGAPLLADQVAAATQMPTFTRP